MKYQILEIIQKYKKEWYKFIFVSHHFENPLNLKPKTRIFEHHIDVIYENYINCNNIKVKEYLEQYLFLLTELQKCKIPGLHLSSEKTSIDTLFPFEYYKKNYFFYSRLCECFLNPIVLKSMSINDLQEHNRQINHKIQTLLNESNEHFDYEAFEECLNDYSIVLNELICNFYLI